MAQDHPKDRIIVALDVDNVHTANGIVQQLTDHVGSFKIGLEFITSALAMLLEPGQRPIAVDGFNTLRALFDRNVKKLFWDGKLSDIPNTVMGASRPMTRLGVKMFNVHCMGGEKMMQDAVLAAAAEQRAAGLIRRPLVLGVTVLTSLSDADLQKLGFTEPAATLVVRLAKLAQACGLDGVVCSPKEITLVREACGPGFKIVTPGIRSPDSPPDDQKRTMTAHEAILAGADELVIGRLITNAADPVEAAKLITQEIADALATKGA